jgi:hypothetical protein
MKIPKIRDQEMLSEIVALRPDLGLGIPKFFLSMRLKWVIEIPL